MPESRNQRGLYFAVFSLHIPDMRNFINMREIAKICARSRTVYIEPVFRYRPPKSDRLLEPGIRDESASLRLYAPLRRFAWCDA